MKSLSPSLLSADFSKLAEEIKAVEEGGAKYIHLDIMDGHFVPNLTFGAPVLRSIRSVTNMVFDVHLMVDNPEKYFVDFANAGADILNVHVEACTDLGKIVDTIHSLNCKAGVTVRPDTPIEAVASVLDKVDMILVMTVYPGFSGQKFIPEALDKIPVLVKARKERNLNFDIQIDGGVSLSNLREVLNAGADSIVAGSAVFGSEDPKKAAEEFVSIIKEYE